MKAATAKEIKDELKEKSTVELREICLRLSRFKKENKELLTYVLFESTDEEDYQRSVKMQMEELFSEINTLSPYYINKSVRKVLRLVKKYIRYSDSKNTEVELMLHFCQSIKELYPDMRRNTALQNIFNRQLAAVKKSIAKLHEDLQYDYSQILEKF
ncbi:MAG: hypothetical protein OCD76_17695 [Reichenbachiella sp.]